MVGDYTSTSYSASGLAHGAFAIAFAPTGNANCAVATPNCDQATYTTASGQASAVATIAETPVELGQINMNAAEHANDNAPFTSR
jgi:hypothetical protein